MLRAEPDWFAISIAGSKRVRWDIDRDVVRARAADPLRRCLPDALSGAGELGFLSEREQVLLSRVQARTYARVAGAADRLVALHAWQARGLGASGEPAIEAFVRMVDEKLKHRDLFQRLAAQLEVQLPPGAVFALNRACAQEVLSTPRWAQLALALHAQLSAQAHYRAAVTAGHALCPLWADVFLFHWKEEAQHAMLVEMAWRREDDRLGPENREAALGRLAQLFDRFARRLEREAAADADCFLRAAGRMFTWRERLAVRECFQDAYRHQHVTQGLEEPRFAAALGSLLTAAQLQAWNARGTHPGRD